MSEDIDFDDETMIDSSATAGLGGGAHPLGQEYPAVDHYGRYDILGRLAVGGMAEVFLAREQSGHGVVRHVAVKRILPQIADDDTFIEMFLDEARLAMRLNHPNICHIYDLGELDDTYYIAMEWVNGIPFGKLINKARERGGVPVNVVVKVIAHVCDALNYAHQARDGVGRPLNIVHRDVSPQNIMVRFDGVVKLLDFGIAKAATQTTQTEAGIVKGKFSYMSPEQCLGKPLDARSDIFSIGACLFEGLTGKPAFRRASDLDTMRAIVHEPVPSARRVRSDVPPRLEAILRKALAKDASQRYQTAGELYVALERFLAEQGDFVHAMHISSAIERLVPEAATRGPFEPDSTPSARRLDIPASGSRPAARGGSGGAVEEDPDLVTLDTNLEGPTVASAGVDIELGDPMDEEELPTETWSGDEIPSIVQKLQEDARAERDGATTNTFNPEGAAIPAIFTDSTAMLDGPKKVSERPPLDPFSQAAHFDEAPREGPSLLLRVVVVVLALFAAALVTVAIVWSTRSTPAAPDPGAGTSSGPEGSSTGTEAASSTGAAAQSAAAGESGATTDEEGDTRDDVAAVTTGVITITSIPAGATVLLGDLEGTTPVTWDEIPAGEHTISLSLEGHVDAYRTVTLTAGETEALDVPLEAEAGEPAEGASDETQEQQEQQEAVSAAAMTPMRRPPVRAQGTLVLDTQPTNTRVFHGNTLLGRTPLRARLPVGTVRLRLVTPDGSSHTRSVRVRPSGQSRAFLPLSR